MGQVARSATSSFERGGALEMRWRLEDDLAGMGPHLLPTRAHQRLRCLLRQPAVKNRGAAPLLPQCMPQLCEGLRSGLAKPAHVFLGLLCQMWWTLQANDPPLLHVQLYIHEGTTNTANNLGSKRSGCGHLGRPTQEDARRAPDFATCPWGCGETPEAATLELLSCRSHLPHRRLRPRPPPPLSLLAVGGPKLLRGFQVHRQSGRSKEVKPWGAFSTASLHDRHGSITDLGSRQARQQGFMADHRFNKSQVAQASAGTTPPLNPI
mmetsp:Transcript_32475/g.85911  ORF Transcript_32475/g.85911 Transcript_32475/m.85911 type:complete len:265 (+) Transcript_32475:1254-2048(+)